MHVAKRHHLEIEQIGRVTVATFTDAEIVEDRTVEAIRQELYRLADRVGPGDLLLDFRNVARAISRLWGLLPRLREAVQGAGGRVALCAIDPGLVEIVKILSFDRLFRIYRTEQEALNALQ
jgi:anti-anti-sigma regulatory factor